MTRGATRVAKRRGKVSLLSDPLELELGLQAFGTLCILI